MNRGNWTAVAMFGVVVLVAFLIGVSLLGGSWGMMGPGMMGPGMMGGWGFGLFGFIGMLFMWLIPIGLVVLTVLGIVWLVRTAGGGSFTPAPPALTCPSCGRGVQADWRHCPHCGATLTPQVS
jgi:hypothetical protein